MKRNNLFMGSGGEGVGGGGGGRGEFNLFVSDYYAVLHFVLF